jgi:hypothetical protein
MPRADSSARQRPAPSGGRLRRLLAPASPPRSTTWEAPPASFRAVEDWSAVPTTVQPRPGEAWLVRDFELAEALIARGAPSERVAVAASASPEAWLQALADAGPVDPVLPPTPYRFGRRLCVVIPTYNEAENLAAMVEEVHRYLECTILVVDDNSPDGTGDIADGLRAKDPAVSVLHRPGKAGLGPAYLAGFQWALAQGFDRIFEMDCDFSHPPWDLPRLAAACESAQLVIGSRYVPGGSTPGWPLRRRLLSRGANTYVRLWLGRRLHDWTAGFRCFQADLLRALPLDAVRSSGYAFQIEMAFRALRHGARVREIPIRFVDRDAGKSKMSRKIATEAIRLVPTLRLRR